MGLTDERQTSLAGTGTDALLMVRLAQRDSTAVSEIYDRHSRLLFGLILRIVGGRTDAEDVLQEVFLTAWTRASTYNPGLGTPVGWLIGIARNRAIDRLRANGSRAHAAEASAHQPADAAVPQDPQREAELGQRRVAVSRALHALPADQRTLIEDAYFLGLTHSELATRHALPLGTIKTRIRTGMLSLRQHLSHSYIEQ